MNFKICSKCKEEKPLKEFEKRSDSRDGLRQYCRKCKAVQTRSAVEKWLEKNHPSYWDKRARSLNSFSSRRRGVAGIVIKNSIPLLAKELEDLFLKDPNCFYCRLPLPKESLVFDHKIPLSREGLHHISNLCVSCHDCNQLKGSRTDIEFRSFLDEYVKRFMLIPR